MGGRRAAAGRGRLRPRRRAARELRDTRSLGEMMAVFSAVGLLRVHRNHAVNLRHVAEVRRRKTDADWEVVLEPPVNQILPVSRTRVRALWAAFGEAPDPGAFVGGPRGSAASRARGKAGSAR